MLEKLSHRINISEMYFFGYLKQPYITELKSLICQGYRTKSTTNFTPSKKYRFLNGAFVKLKLFPIGLCSCIHTAKRIKKKKRTSPKLVAPHRIVEGRFFFQK